MQDLINNKKENEKQLEDSFKTFFAIFLLTFPFLMSSLRSISYGSEKNNFVLFTLFTLSVPVLFMISSLSFLCFCWIKQRNRDKKIRFDKSGNTVDWDNLNKAINTMIENSGYSLKKGNEEYYLKLKGEDGVQYEFSNKNQASYSRFFYVSLVCLIIYTFFISFHFLWYLYPTASDKTNDQLKGSSNNTISMKSDFMEIVFPTDKNFIIYQEKDGKTVSVFTFKINSKKEDESGPKK